MGKTPSRFMRGLVAGASVRALAAAGVLIAGLGLNVAAAQETPPAEAAVVEEVVVTGFRASLQSALNLKRQSNQIIDAITAEDIADFPDANLAESIQRLPGVSIDRDNGEGRSITIRGLGGDFQMVRLNGADAQNVSGSNNADTGANRTRGFDFNTFASELFGGIKVTKSMAAENDEGSLGAIIDLTTGRPLNYKSNRFALGADSEYRQNGKSWNPRFTGLASVKLTDTFGVLVSGAYQKQDQEIDSYRRNTTQAEYVYRNSAIAGVTPAVYGFARPSNQGTGPTFGSDPAAYALLTPTTLFPALPSINRQGLNYERIGLTATAQWRPSARTEVTLDGVFSRYDQSTETDGITPVGLNRNGTNARVTQGTLRAPGTANGNADRLALYPTCSPSATLDCDGTLSGNAVLPGYLSSMNPNNLDPFDYYNNPASPGYVATANQTGFFNELIGRPNTKVRAAHVNAAGQADYMVLDDVDWRSFADSQEGRTDFKQATLNARQEFTDKLRVDATLGWSKSSFRGSGLLAEFNAIDKDNYVFDARGGGKMPVFSPGFDVASPGSWDLVKGLSTIRFFRYQVDNAFKVGRLNFTYEATPELALKFGGTWKRFSYEANQGRNSQAVEAINPTLAEAGLKITDLGKVFGFGQGLNVSQGTPTSFFAPDLGKFVDRFQIDCNCVNKWGDYRALADGRQTSAVTEEDLSGYVQADYDLRLLDRPLRGNAGMRVAKTKVAGDGNVGGANGVTGIPVTAHNDYTDWLPSMNANWEVADGMLLRLAASKTISRPQLAALTPGTTSYSSGLSTNGSAPSLTVGNPYLSPYRSTNLDLSFEKYFRGNGLIGVTLFNKDLKSFPQQIAGEAALSSAFEPAIYQQLLDAMTSPQLRAYTEAGGVWAIRQFKDAPGGKIQGIEVNLQTDFWFLPAPFDKFGVTANYTHIKSSLSYLTGSTLATTQAGGTGTAQNTFAKGPFLNTSPDAFNATLYYENGPLSARISGAYRTRYVNRFPLSSGTCSVGTTTSAGGPCNAPVMSDFGYNEDQLNIDFATSFALTDWAKLTLEGRNLTNEAQYRTMYEANPVTQTYSSSGRIITAGVRVVF
jgi:iron complex outermembrane receptor protein